MKRRRPTWLCSLLGLLLLWLMSLPAAAQSPPALWADDFCGTSQSHLICPRTSQDGCLCSLSARATSPPGEALLALEPSLSPKLVPFRPALRRVLGQVGEESKVEEFHPPVPTQPPR